LVNDVWHRLFPIGVSADDQAAIRKHNEQQNRNARKRRRGDPEAAAEMEAAATRTLEEKAAEDRAKEEKAAENRAKDAARKREARQAGKADVHKVQPRVDPTPLSPARAKVPSPPPLPPRPSRTGLLASGSYARQRKRWTSTGEERRAKDAYLEHLQGEVRAVFADDTKSCAYLSFRHKGIDRSGHWENDRRYSAAASKGSFERDVWKRYTFAREMAADGDVPVFERQQAGCWL
jgi:hypothetical protein